MVRRTLLGIAMLALVGAAACSKNTVTPSGSGSSPTASTSSSPTTEPITKKGTKDVTSGVQFTLEADNDGTTAYYFDPTFLKAKPGEKITVQLENKGSVEHNFSITALGINIDLAVGAKVTKTFTLPATGDVQFFCEYHHAFGMRGAFFFGSAPQADAATTTGSASTTTY
jgi:plastocyanin